MNHAWYRDKLYDIDRNTLDSCNECSLSVSLVSGKHCVIKARKRQGVREDKEHIAKAMLDECRSGINVWRLRVKHNRRVLTF